MGTNEHEDRDLDDVENMQAYLGVVAARCGVPQRWFEDFVQEGVCCTLEFRAAGHSIRTALVYGVRAARRELGRWMSEEPAPGQGSLSNTRRKVNISQNLKPGLEMWFSRNAASRRVNKEEI